MVEDVIWSCNKNCILYKLKKKGVWIFEFLDHIKILLTEFKIGIDVFPNFSRILTDNYTIISLAKNKKKEKYKVIRFVGLKELYLIFNS